MPHMEVLMFWNHQVVVVWDSFHYMLKQPFLLQEKNPPEPVHGQIFCYHRAVRNLKNATFFQYSNLNSIVYNR